MHPLLLETGWVHFDAVLMLAELAFHFRLKKWTPIDNAKVKTALQNIEIKTLSCTSGPIY